MNTNVLRAVTTKLRELQDQGVSTEAVAIGGKGLGFPEPCQRQGGFAPRVWATRPIWTSSSGLSRCCWSNTLKASWSAVYPGVHQVHQHHEAGNRWWNKLLCRPENTGREDGDARWDTSTNLTLKASLTNCCCVTRSLVYRKLLAENMASRPIGAHGGHERLQPTTPATSSARVEACLQQDASGSHYDRVVGNRWQSAAV